MLQLSTHHARTRLDPVNRRHAFTQFREGEIGLFLDFGTNEFCAALKCAWGAVGLGASCRLPRLALPVQPFLDGRQANTKGGGYGNLRLITCVGGGKDAFAQVRTIGIHVHKFSSSEP